MNRLENAGGQTKHFIGAIRMLEISNYKKVLLCDRFLTMLSDLEKKAKFYSRVYNYGSAVTTIGALLVPAMLSIQSQDNEQIVYWSTWSIALTTGLANSLLALYNVAKKNVLFGKSLETLVSEGFRYLGLTSNYEPEEDEQGSHEKKFSDFLDAIERLHLSDVSKAYAKNAQNQNQSVDEEKNSKDALFLDIHSNMIDSELNKLDEEEKKM